MNKTRTLLNEGACTFTITVALTIRIHNTEHVVMTYEFVVVAAAVVVVLSNRRETSQTAPATMPVRFGFVKRRIYKLVSPAKPSQIPTFPITIPASHHAPRRALRRRRRAAATRAVREAKSASRSDRRPVVDSISS
jgi:hypothetical protein